MSPWFEPETVGLVGAVLGVGIGVVFGGIGGGLGGYLASKGKARTFVLGLWVLASIMGIASLGTGVAALVQRQPYHVWYPFVLLGGLLTLLGPMMVVVFWMRYRQAEERQLAAEELRRSGA